VTFGQIVGRIQSPFRLFGVLGGIAYVIDRVLVRIPGQLRLHVYDFMEQPITGKALLPRRLGKGLEVRPIHRDDSAVRLMPPPATVKRRRLEQGAECLGAYVKDELVAYMWFCRDQYREDEIRCDYILHPKERSVFDFDVYVFPERRMGLAFAKLWSGANQLLFDEGIRHSFSRVNRFNVSSKRAHDRLGWRRVGSATALKAWDWELLITTVSPYLSFSLSDAQRPKLHLRASAGERSGPLPLNNSAAEIRCSRIG